MTKEEKIKDLEFLNEMKKNVDEMVDGFDLVNLQHVQQMIDDWIHDLNTSQSESSNNNGWIRIESEEDLPKENGVYWTIRDCDNGYNPSIEIFDGGFHNYNGWKVTHYQTIEKPKPPIY